MMLRRAVSRCKVKRIAVGSVTPKPTTQDLLSRLRREAAGLFLPLCIKQQRATSIMPRWHEIILTIVVMVIANFSF